MPGKQMKALLLWLAVSMPIAACSAGTTATDKEDAPSDRSTAKTPAIDKPTELTLYHPWGMTQQLFMETEGKYVVKKYPNLTFKVLNRSNGTLEELVASGTKIDLVYATETELYLLKQFNLDSDASDLIKLYGYDLDKVEPAVANYIKTYNGGKIPALPTQLQTLALYYNKSLFDKFGVPYATDRMTWDQLYDLSRKLTRSDGGVVYRGYADGAINNSFRFNPFSMPLVDPLTNKAVFDNDRMKQYLDQLIRPLTIPEYSPQSDTINNNKARDMFRKEQTLAMVTMMTTDFPRASTGDTVNWAAVSYPTFKDLPGVGPQPEIIMWYVTSTSGNREAAFLAAAEMTSVHVQTELFKEGSITILKDKSGLGTFGSSLPDLSGKNVKALIPDKYAEKSPYSRYAPTAAGQLVGVYVQSALGTKDRNTSFREAVERTDKAIEQSISTK
ncbi:extracellular solute-binding protein [Paenibacillus hemerocallicola]|uniref:Extracellular solute-binding protein n=1 Tax=Paenibacillus hemerocallicola TaxID=1172614 RepID=A0A5C4TD14_9BACL|nr:extracellular solute-binding protein [Paenibacillus hemerocallicola]TNJ66948.1 extracellular solute-binding protein [Paenibacillus hemerocallicola]